jgi:hypothetical protein
MTEQEFVDAIEPMRDTDIWEKDADDEWKLKDSVGNHRDAPGVDDVRPDMTSDMKWSDVVNPITEYDDQEFITL